MHYLTFVAALLLPFAACRDASIPAGGAECATTCYGNTCLGAAAMFAGLSGDAACETLESWGCDCEGCDCDDAFDLDSIDNVPDDYSCGPYNGEDGAPTCDELAWVGYNCHSLETRRAADCSGCLCEEVILDYVKGDSSCPHSCLGSTCDVHNGGFNSFSCESLESFDTIFGCDCSGCECTTVDNEGWTDIAYNGMDCNGNWYWNGDDLGDDTCGEEVGSFTYPMGNPTDGYEEQTWFVCLSCPELECDMGDCGVDACGRDGSTCALPLCELCADEDSQFTPTQFGRSVYCTEDSYTCAPSPAPTEASTEAATEATVAADKDGSLTLTTTAVFAIALLLA